MTEDIMKLADDVQEKIMQQYEDIRASGACNMFNYTDVKYVANELHFTELFLFMRDSTKAYMSILKNFSTLMKKF